MEAQLVQLMMTLHRQFIKREHVFLTHVFIGVFSVSTKVEHGVRNGKKTKLDIKERCMIPKIILLHILKVLTITVSFLYFFFRFFSLRETRQLIVS